MCLGDKWGQVRVRGLRSHRCTWIVWERGPGAISTGRETALDMRARSACTTHPSWRFICLAFERDTFQHCSSSLKTFFFTYGITLPLFLFRKLRYMEIYIHKKSKKIQRVIVFTYKGGFVRFLSFTKCRFYWCGFKVEGERIYLAINFIPIIWIWLLYRFLKVIF